MFGINQGQQRGGSARPSVWTLAAEPSLPFSRQTRDLIPEATSGTITNAPFGSNGAVYVVIGGSLRLKGIISWMPHLWGGKKYKRRNTISSLAIRRPPSALEGKSTRAFQRQNAGRLSPNLYHVESRAECASWDWLRGFNFAF